MELSILTDRTNTIRASVADVKFELVLTICLVVMVIFLFLRSFAATVIPAVAVPLSIVGTFGVMYLLGYSLNNLSLMALTISTGFVVDDAIVMIENIDRYLEMGDSPLDAALKGSEQIGFTILSLTVSLIAVLIPLLFHGRHRGAAVPRVCRHACGHDPGVGCSFADADADDGAKLLKHKPKSQQNAFYRKSEEFFEYVIAKYGVGVKWVLAHQTLTLLVTLATFVLTLSAVHRRAQGLLPGAGHRRAAGDHGGRSVRFVRRDEQASADAGAHHTRRPRCRLRQQLHRHRCAELYAEFRPHPDQPEGQARSALRPRSQVIQRLQPNVNKIDGIQTFLQPLQDLTVEDRVSRTQYQFSVEDASAAELATATDTLVKKFKTLPVHDGRRQRSAAERSCRPSW